MTNKRPNACKQNSTLDLDLLSDIPALRSDITYPDFYTIPNPDFGDFGEVDTPAKPVSEPCSTPVSAGKNTYVYDAHTYHTKVPPQGIQTFIDYYTRPGDVVLDPFCGSGMTGVAATELGRKAVLCDISPAAAFIAYNHTDLSSKF